MLGVSRGRRENSQQLTSKSKESAASLASAGVEAVVRGVVRVALLVSSTTGLGASVAIATLADLGLITAVFLAAEHAELTGVGAGELDGVGGNGGGKGQKGGSGELHGYGGENFFKVRERRGNRKDTDTAEVRGGSQSTIDEQRETRVRRGFEGVLDGGE